jgi:hypothetical protein
MNKNVDEIFAELVEAKTEPAPLSKLRSGSEPLLAEFMAGEPLVSLLVVTSTWEYSLVKFKKRATASKLHGPPQRPTVWMSPGDAIAGVIELADKGFVPRGEVGKYFGVISLDNTHKGTLTCSKFGSYPLTTNHDLLVFDDARRFCSVDEVTLKCTGIDGREMMPTKKAESEIEELRIRRRLESRSFRESVFKHGVTMDQVWAIQKEVTPKKLDSIKKKLGEAAREEIIRRMELNKKNGHQCFFGFEENNSLFVKEMNAAVLWGMKGNKITLQGIARISPDKLAVVATNEQEIIVLLQHFIERYMERLGIDEQDEDIALSLLVKEIDAGAGVQFDKVRNRSSIFTAIRSGVCLGSTVSAEGMELTVVKTFVPENMLSPEQLGIYRDIIALNAKNNLL